MAAYFLCLTSGGGIPLFYRIKGDLKPLPFPIIGSLNGVHMFCGSQGVDLQTTTTDDSKIVWKVYHNSITLIIITKDDNGSNAHLTSLLDFIFNSMVLVYGLDDLINIKNVERFKREIKVCYQIVDNLLEEINNPTFGDLTHAVDVICAQENAILQTYLDAFSDSANSPYGCVLVQGKVAVGTKKWWGLSSHEKVLLSTLINSLPKCSSRDIAIFLPDNSPKVPHRLLTFQLVQGVEVCVLCGPTPSLADLERDIDRFWRSSLDSLASILALNPRNLPYSVSIDPNVLGLMLLNTDSHKCLCSVHPHEGDPRKPPKGLSIARRRDALRSFYRHVVGNLWQHPISNGPETGKSDDMQQHLLHAPSDTYICGKESKCYALRQNEFQVFVLFGTSIPTYAMRSVTNNILNLLLKDKHVNF